MSKVVNIRERKAERKREEIVRAGLKVFSEKGFRAATMDDIALELESTKGLLYYHFKTKEEILSAILQNNTLIAGIEEIFSQVSAMAPVAALQTAAERALKLMEEHRELIRFLEVQTLLSQSEAEVVYSQVLERLYLRLTEIITSFKTAGHIRVEIEPRSFAQFLIDSVIGFFIQRQLFGARFIKSHAEHLQQLLTILMHGALVSHQAQGKPS